MTQNNEVALIEFKDAVKQLCNDFSSLQGNVYIKDVEASLDALCEQYIESPISQNEHQEEVTNLWEALGKWSAYLASNGEQANLAPPSWLIDAVSSATSPHKQAIPDGGYQAATQASEIEINALKERVAELEEEVIKYQSIVSEQKIIIHAIKGECKDMGVTDICVALGRKDIEIVELQAHVNQLREAGQALVDRWNTPKWKDAEHTAKFIHALEKALSSTPTQSLAEHDNEVIQMCANEFNVDSNEYKTIQALKATP